MEKGQQRINEIFFHNAYGSLRECQTIFEILNLEDGALLKSADQLGANYGIQGDELILILMAGSKRIQQADIKKARLYSNEWKERTS